jgi:preprotein translocase subunit SecE
MNREMRRLSEREERRSKKEGGKRGRKSPITGKGGSNAGKQGRISRLAQFMREVHVELKRVGWPTRQQMVAFTSVTLITTVALTLFTFAMDFGFRKAVIAFIRTLTG